MAGRRSAVVVALLAAGVPATAAAQDRGGANADAIKPAEPPPGFWEGGGVPIGGTTVMHPNFELSTAYQTNTFYQAPGEPQGIQPSLVLRLGAGLVWQSK